jgi:hypothetical protein
LWDRDVCVVEAWYEVTEVNWPLVALRGTYFFESDGAVLTPTETLRFRERDEVSGSLGAARLLLEDVRDARDRPGREFVFIAQRAR